ncbi:LLM class flavin-dependent oxidoreductase [Streptomyces sp. HNM0574]|uniref:LLM class flavin-dependent oxidoreductase n=1 Tax=Streptomyces sp. HNM0574 TaxID=2714954 RepID=UPI00146AE946|nr:LLM class flavin-dependent oxidoreductase [Streptomyces sp. HNM0574]NLU69766.1 LLM class flavin-dependent oxidoreductase [Streptomyces sp. HNM0574]
MSAVRFNLVDPAQDDPATPRGRTRERYAAALEMAEYADGAGLTSAIVEEHHGSPDGWLPAPLTLAGLLLGRTRRLTVLACAVLAPLHDPLRLAEQLAVLDLAGGGRLTTVAGIGYRPEEYEAAGVPWAERGRRQDEVLETLLAAWTGEPFTFRGRTVRVTPRPYSPPSRMLFAGGTSRPAARRAARLGLPLFTAAHLPALEAYYTERCAEYGTEGMCVMPPGEAAMLHVTEDPERAWARLGGHFLYEARRYASWQTAATQSSLESAAGSVEELRREGIYRMVTPDECVELARSTGQATLHPLCGGMPVEEAWSSLELFADKVLPRLGE